MTLTHGATSCFTRYGFSDADALALSGLDVAVVGGANSAVQAAISLARDGRAVHLIVRGNAPNASEYLIEQGRCPAEPDRPPE